MKANYFSITIYIKGRGKAFKGIRVYDTDNYNEVYKILLDGLLKYYYLADILKIDVSLLSENSIQVKEYLEQKSKKNETNSN